MNQRPSLTPRTQTKLSNKFKYGVGGSAVALSAIAAFLFFLGGKGEGKLPGFSFRKAIVVDSTFVQGKEFMEDFPVWLEIEDPDLKHESKGGKVKHMQGFDIRFAYGDGATLQMHRIERYNPNSGKLTAYVNIDTLFPGKSNVLYMYFGSEQNLISREVTIGERSMAGHYLDGGDDESRHRNDRFPFQSINTEYINHQKVDSFAVVGPLEELDATLPVEYAYLKGELKASQMVLIEWGSDIELDNDHFTIERSKDAKNFSPLAEMGGGGKSDYTLRYSFNDSKPLNEGAYYRVKQTNDDGSFSYSDMVDIRYRLNQKGLEIVSVEPNPFINEFTAIYTMGAEGEVKIIFYTQDGEVIHEEKVIAPAGQNEFSFNEGGGLGKGAYVLSMTGEDRKLKVVTLLKEEMGGKGVVSK